MIYRTISILVLGIITVNFIYAQRIHKFTNEQRTVQMIENFNHSLFFDLDYKTAIENHIYMNEADSTDQRFGVRSDFFEITKKINVADKNAFYFTDFYLNFGIPFLQWQIGRNIISSKTQIIDGEIADDKIFEQMWDKTLVKLGLTEEMLDNSGSKEKRLEFENTISNALAIEIAKQVDKKLIAKNLNFIKKNTKITKEVFEEREYFTVENKIFSYKVAIKNNVPKIMHINRN